ncbi:phage baseplate assembly protein V [Haliangium sp.]|uniref:phage baseplate assembly protein V n=1 Tax=Haliangium sp. TaxID=2663208 RepID=UPI003D0E2FB3
MPGFEDDLLDARDPRFFGIYEGFVVDCDDPDKLGRVRVQVPGLLEPMSGWAYPAGTVGGGAKDCGFFAVPPKGAEVYVFFVGGDLDQPRYLAGHWGVTDAGNEVPAEAQRPSPDNRVIATPNFRIELDEGVGSRGLRITNKTTGDLIELNAEDNSITIQATTALTLRATGLVDISGAIVQINGRPVLAGGDPI